MAEFAALLKIQVLGAFGINRALHERNRRVRMRLALVGAGIAAAVALGAVYAWTLAQSLAALGAVDAVPALAVAVGSLSGAAVTFLKANGQLFGFSDFDSVMALPVPCWQVVLSRIAALYGMNLAFAAVFMAPMLLSYAAVAGADAFAVIACVASIFAAPLLPMAAAVLLAYGLAALSSRMRRAKAAMGLLALAATIAAVACIMAATARANAVSTNELQVLAYIGQAVSSQVEAAYPPAAWAAQGIKEENWALFSCFIAASVASMAIAVCALAKWYAPINSALAAGGSHASASRRAYRPATPMAAMARKELRLLLNTPIYLTNTAVGPLLALALGVAFLLLDPEGVVGGLALPQAVAAQMSGFIASAAPWAIAFCLVIAPTSASSVSLEGRSRWIMQSVPVPFAHVIASKAAANASLGIPAALVAGVLAAVGFDASFAQTAAFVLAPLAGTAFSSSFGAFMDARAPRYDWTSEYEPVKRSVAVAANMFAGMALSFGCGIAAVVAGEFAPLATIACAFAIMAASAGILRAAMRIDLRD